MNVIIGAIIAYLYGAIPFGYMATYVLTGKKLTEEGTGNIGITNTYKVAGTIAVIIALLGETSKAVIPIIIGYRFFDRSLSVTLLLVLCSLVGTSFSIFLKGKGGKGSTAAFWSILILSPISFVLLLMSWMVLAWFAKLNLHIKKLQLLIIPCVIALVERDLVFTLFGALASILFFLNSYARKDDFAYYNLFKQRSGV